MNAQRLAAAVLVCGIFAACAKKGDSGSSNVNIQSLNQLNQMAQSGLNEFTIDVGRVQSALTVSLPDGSQFVYILGQGSLSEPYSGLSADGLNLTAVFDSGLSSACLAAAQDASFKGARLQIQGSALILPFAFVNSEVQNTYPSGTASAEAGQLISSAIQVQSGGAAVPAFSNLDVGVVFSKITSCQEVAPDHPISIVINSLSSVNAYGTDCPVNTTFCPGVQVVIAGVTADNGYVSAGFPMNWSCYQTAQSALANHMPLIISGRGTVSPMVATGLMNPPPVSFFYQFSEIDQCFSAIVDPVAASP